MTALDHVDDGSLDERPLSDFAGWIAIVADFSFHPWQDLLPAATRG